MTMTLPTLKVARAAHPLAPAVLRQLGGGRDAVQSAIDAAQHGADGGFPGFTYHSDTIRFASRHRAAIRAALADDADNLGESGAIGLVRSFACFRGDQPTEDAVAEALHRPADRDRDDISDADSVRNALSWYALATVGRAIEALAASR